MKNRNLDFSVLIILMTAVFLLPGCSQKDVNTEAGLGYYEEPYRPQFHFSPAANWMNDPNGMVYYAGEYHLFYQHYPDSNVWGPMHWGHAVSTDMVNWKHLPLALYPDSLGMIFSGSAVMDMNNTSGLGSDDNPAMVAIFTYHNPDLEKSGSNTFQSQGLAYSLDKGRTWIKYAENPVLKNPGIRDFRDPKVFWHKESDKWIMILAVQDRVHLYSSPNLTDWTFESEFGKSTGAHGGVWECPDMFPLIVSGSDVMKWVMLVSINPGGPNSGSATQYFIGDFDGHRFSNDTNGNEWVDWGRDNYAGVTWSDIPESDGRRLFLGWMSNWQYATVVPTFAWRSAMTIPRELSLIRNSRGYRLLSAPVKELEFLRKGNPVAFSSREVSGEIPLTPDSIRLSQCEISLGFSLKHHGVDSMGIMLQNDRQEKFTISYSPITKKIVVDRALAGSSAFSAAFSGQAEAPYQAGDYLQFRLFVDASSVELFVDNGNIVMTSLVFPAKEFTSLILFSSGGTVVLEKAEFYNLKRIW